MQDVDLFLSLAEIAGVFVGFAALISVRSGGASEAHEVAYIRSVVWLGLWVVIAALAPVVVSRYDLTGHAVWLACSLIALALFVGGFILNRRTPEHRADMASYPRSFVLGGTILVASFVIPVAVALILIVLGVVPHQEPALYITAVALVLFFAAFALLSLVFTQGRPQTASDPAALPATGGSSA
jgi:hypothetical protein